MATNYARGRALQNDDDEKDDTRMDTPKVMSDDTRTASEDTVLSTSVSPDQGRNDAAFRALERLHFAVLEYFSYSPSRREERHGVAIDDAMRVAGEVITARARATK